MHSVRISRYLMAILVVCFCYPAFAQQQRRTLRKKPNDVALPGLDKRPQAVREKLIQQFQVQLDARKALRKLAARQSLRHKRAADAALRSQNSESADRLLFLAAQHAVAAERWELAHSLLTNLSSRTTASPATIAGRLLLFDLEIETRRDVDAARQQVAAMLKWAEAVAFDKKKKPSVVAVLRTTGARGELPLGSPGPNFPRPRNDEPFALPPEAVIAADVFLRAGMIAWLDGESLTAAERFERAIQLDATHAGPLMNLAQMSVGRSPLPITDYKPLGKEPVEMLKLIRYADVLQRGRAFYRAHRLWDGLLKRHLKQLTPIQRSFVFYRRGQSRYAFANPIERNVSQILSDYSTAYKTAPSSPWADDMLLLGGNLVWNFRSDADFAVEHWQTLIEKFPKSPHAPRTAYFIGIAYERTKRWQEANTAYSDAKKRYPKSSYNKLIDQHQKRIKSRLPRE